MTDEKAQFIARHALSTVGLDEHFIRRHEDSPEFCEVVTGILSRQRETLEQMVEQNRVLRIRLDEARRSR